MEASLADQKDLVGKSLWNFLPASEVVEQKEFFCRVIETATLTSTQTSWVSKYGSVRFIDWSVDVVCQDGGVVTNVIFSGIDITEKNRAVDKIKQEVKVTFVASTISEHIFHEGELAATARSEKLVKLAEDKAKRAEADAKRAKAETKRVALINLEELFEEGLISTEVFETKAAPLRKALIQLSRQAGEGPAVTD